MPGIQQVTDLWCCHFHSLCEVSITLSSHLFLLMCIDPGGISPSLVQSEERSPIIQQPESGHSGPLLLGSKSVQTSQETAWPGTSLVVSSSFGFVWKFCWTSAWAGWACGVCDHQVWSWAELRMPCAWLWVRLYQDYCRGRVLEDPQAFFKGWLEFSWSLESNCSSGQPISEETGDLFDGCSL